MSTNWFNAVANHIVAEANIAFDGLLEYEKQRIFMIEYWRIEYRITYGMTAAR